MSDLNMPGREDGVHGDHSSSDEEDHSEEESEGSPVRRTPPPPDWYLRHAGWRVADGKRPRYLFAGIH